MCSCIYIRIGAVLAASHGYHGPPGCVPASQPRIPGTLRGRRQDQPPKRRMVSHRPLPPPAACGRLSGDGVLSAVLLVALRLASTACICALNLHCSLSSISGSAGLPRQWQGGRRQQQQQRRQQQAAAAPELPDLDALLGDLDMPEIDADLATVQTEQGAVFDVRKKRGRLWQGFCQRLHWPRLFRGFRGW